MKDKMQMYFDVSKTTETGTLGMDVLEIVYLQDGWILNETF